MTEIRILSPDAAGLDRLLAGLRASDKAELDALQPGLEYGRVLRRCVDLSVWVRMLWREDIPLAVTGVIPDGGGCHAPWLVGTDAISRFPLAFMRACRAIVEGVYRAQFAPLLNYVDAGQARSLRFIRSLGFLLGDAIPLGPGGHPFLKFTMGV